MAAVSLVLALAGTAAAADFSAGVTATGTMGPNNPPKPTLGTDVNQTSMARLISLNSVDDWCIFAPPEEGVTIGESEAFEVAWCTKQRNNARVIPDGTITGASFIKTDFYVELKAYGDFTKLNLQASDFGGELDPHGATGEGNPVGGNVTSNAVTGDDVNFEEWMSFISYNQVCFRICTNANDTWDAAIMCEHKLDEMGCNFVMPGNYDFNGTFESCEGEVAYPPGVYITAIEGSSTGYSTFAQFFTGTITEGGSAVPYTVGTTVTPSSVQMTPSSSNCKTTKTISNGISLSTGADGSVSASGGAAATQTGDSSSGASSSSGSSGSSSSDGGSDGALSLTSYFHEGVTVAALIAGGAAVVLLS
ncbi:hypothetical protein CYLTODRAFT_372950 [Cylindrobasidium torrendii FP15055 ss-10]|uniref:Immunoreactive mannoprotein MP88 n=1 Tax=Cylindrobasidium torrendii FP15055 ss-10 TaxID=1314674 RepID=A0A0D7BGN4_9AGAR|nr:hypothetical protein CYLTODRAFT_372950 [Cylindrobasidium torrendii FP15055 ss-10]